MFIFLAFLGKAAWPIIGALVPWGGAKMGGILGVVLLALVVIGFPAGYAYHKGSQGKGEAVARCESACSIREAEKETAYQRTLADILQEVQAGDEPAPKTQTDLDEACKRSSMCRENK